MNSYTAIFVLLVLAPVFFVGCFKNYEVYGYQKAEKEYEWGVVGAKLMGSKKKEGNTIIKNAPYDLLIWFGSDTLLDGSAKITDLYLWDLKTKKIALTIKNTPEVYLEKLNSKYRAYFTFEDIKMDYSEAVLNIKFVFRKDSQQIENGAEFHFKPEFKKFRRIVGV